MNKMTWMALTMSAALFFPPSTILQAQVLPSSISNLQLWLDASDPNGNTVLPSNGTTVTSWKDKSGHNRNTALYNAGAVYTSPVYYGNQINGKGVIRFTRGSAGTIGSGYSAPLDIRAMTNPEITLFTVYKQGTQVGEQAVWGCDNGGFDRFFFSSRSTNFNTGSVSIGDMSPYLVDVTGAGQLGQVKCLTAVYSKASGTNGSAIYFNGQLVMPFTDYTTSGSDALQDVRIGLDGDDNFYNGDIAEMIIYNRKLSPCEITQVNRYLNSKYGVSFSTVNIAAGGTTTFNEGGSVTLSSTTTGTAFQWLRNGTAIGGANTSTYVASTTGNYSLAVANGCIDTSAAISVTAYVPAPPATALKFDGIKDFIDCGTTLTAPGIKTLECWAKFSSLTTDQEILSKSKVGYGIELLMFGNTLSFFCMNNPNTSYISYPSTNLVTGKWYHLVGTWDGSDRTTMRLYINGVSVGTRTDAGNINSSGIADPGAGTHFYVGGWNDGGRFFSGSLDEIRIWNKVRTEAEIRANAYDTIARNTSGLLAYLRLDQGTAGGTNTSISTVKDFSSSNLTAQLDNFTLTGSASNFVESYAMVAPMPQVPNILADNGFTIKWTAPAVGVVDNYVLDVSTNSNFSSFVPGYNGLNVGLATSYNVTGLTYNNTYYARLRANKSTLNGEGANTYNYVSAIANAILPVKWESFSVSAHGSSASIDWITGTEDNSRFFTIERSTDGVGFTALTQIHAAGNSQQKTVYNWLDQHPAAGVNYYRIKLTDIDGKGSYSVVRFLNFSDNADRVSLFPSPATDYIFIDVQDDLLVNTTITIFNLQAQPVVSFKAQQGLQKKYISSLAKGMYVVKMANGKSIKFQKN